MDGLLRPHATDSVNQLDLVPENTYGSLLARGGNVGAAIIKVRPDDQRVARPLSDVGFRACDVFAWLLSGVEGAPEFEVYWRETARNAAIDDLIRFLREHQGAFVYSQERFYKLHYAAQ